jgi:hypothetical protein
MLPKFSEEDISMHEGAIDTSRGNVKAANNVKFK